MAAMTIIRGHQDGHVLVDVDGRWWKGFYRGWMDGAEGREPGLETVRGSVCPAGYDAGWMAGRIDRDEPGHLHRGAEVYN
jgi:hypothetical protein